MEPVMIEIKMTDKAAPEPPVALRLKEASMRPKLTLKQISEKLERAEEKRKEAAALMRSRMTKDIGKIDHVKERKTSLDISKTSSTKNILFTRQMRAWNKRSDAITGVKERARKYNQRVFEKIKTHSVMSELEHLKKKEDMNGKMQKATEAFSEALIEKQKKARQHIERVQGQIKMHSMKSELEHLKQREDLDAKMHKANIARMSRIEQVKSTAAQLAMPKSCSASPSKKTAAS